MTNINSPLQLLDFQIMKFHFEIAEGVEPDLAQDQHAELDFDLRFRDEDADDCLLVLRQSLNASDEDFERCGIRVLGTVGGIFDISNLKQEYPDKSQWQSFLVVNGLSVLYSMLRQLVAQTAAQSPVRRITLPTSPRYLISVESLLCRLEISIKLSRVGPGATRPNES